VNPFRPSTRRRDTTIAVDADLTSLARRNAALSTPTDPTEEPVVAVLITRAVDDMSRRFREDEAVASTARDRATAQARHVAAVDDGGPGPGATSCAPAGGDTTDVTVIAAEVAHARRVRAERQARAALDDAGRQQETAERDVVDALVVIARRTLTAANTYLAALNAARADLGRRAIPPLEDEVIDLLFGRAVRQPVTTVDDPEEA
jgi:hypothetical protein